jgi:hypothetical protein
VLVVIALGACSPKEPQHDLDLHLIRVAAKNARLRTDTVGDGRFAETSAFVLVDAENAADQGAYVTIAGELIDAAGTVIGRLKPQSLWTPAHESRTFALVDLERKPRPTATSARIVVRGALTATSVTAPHVHVEDLHTFVDDNRIVVQAYVVNDADRFGNVMVIASFHGADGRPMKRPFDMVQLAARARTSVQFVGPTGSKRGTIYIGDVVY